MFEYVPGNYVWNLGVVAALNSGGLIDEFDRACRPIRDGWSVSAVQARRKSGVPASTGYDLSDPAGVDHSSAEPAGAHGHHISGQMLPLDGDPKSAT